MQQSIKSYIHTGWIILLACLFSAGIAHSSDLEFQWIDYDRDGEDDIQLENSYLRVVVTAAQGGRIVSLYDKLRERELVKQRPVESVEGRVNEIRLEGSFHKGENPINAKPFALSVHSSGPESLVVSAKLDSYILDENEDEVPVTFVKQYEIRKGSTAVKVRNEVHNHGKRTIRLMPWVKNMLVSGKEKEPFVSLMTKHGIYRSDHIVPDEDIAKSRKDYKWLGKNLHIFPDANWSSLTMRPLNQESCTFSGIFYPADMWKCYFWRKFYNQKMHEDFITQETILTVKSADPDKAIAFDYYLTLTEPVSDLVYSSPELNIGLTPHPTGISFETKEIKLILAPTLNIGGLQIQWQLCDLQDGAVHNGEVAVAMISPVKGAEFTIPVQLHDMRNYQLKLNLSHEGIPYHPGKAVGDTETIIIPIVVGSEFTTQTVFTSRVNRASALPYMVAKKVYAPMIASNHLFSAYQYSAARRCFKKDILESSGNSSLEIRAMAGEYASLQIVFVPKGTTETLSIRIAAPQRGGSTIVVDQISQFIYPITKEPSFYSPKFMVGAYPAALLPTDEIRFALDRKNTPIFITFKVPEEAVPGNYHGRIIIGGGGENFSLPVKIHLWNIKMPNVPTISVSADLKGFAKTAIEASRIPLRGVELRQAVVDVHLKHYITPYGYAGLKLDNPQSWEADLDKIEDQGISDIGLGNLNKIIARYGNERIKELDNVLKKRDMVRRFYVRTGFDEASRDLAPEIRAVCEQWKALTSIPIMETYYHDNPKELYGCLDIYCSYPGRASWKKERRKCGDRFFGVNLFPQRLEESPWSGRRLYWRAFDSGITGSYLWTLNKWGVREWGKDWWTDGCAGNLEACLMWPHATGILSTIRLESVRDGIEDHALLTMLSSKANALIKDDPQHVLAREALGFLEKSPGDQIHSAEDLKSLRDQAGRLLSRLNDWTN